MIHERNNTIDRHAIAARKRSPGELVETVGHFPKEIFREPPDLFCFTELLVSAKVMDTHQPLVQGGLEIPIEKFLTMMYEEPAEMESSKNRRNPRRARN